MQGRNKKKKRTPNIEQLGVGEEELMVRKNE